SQDRDPWASLTGFRLNRPAHEVMWVEHDGRPALMRLSQSGEATDITLEPDASAAARREGRDAQAPITFSYSGRKESSAGALRLAIDDASFTAFAAPHNDKLRIWIGADHWDVAFPYPLAGISAHHSSEGSLTAPMPGVITLLSAKPGDEIEAGKPLLVMEAMKMEHAIKAPYDGVVKAYKFNPGDQVKDGDLLVEFEENA
ncbi:MAG: biotin/lipoyl-containing protein, partial [Pseudomonadota bacterium]